MNEKQTTCISISGKTVIGMSLRRVINPPEIDY